MLPVSKEKLCCGTEIAQGRWGRSNSVRVFLKCDQHERSQEKVVKVIYPVFLCCFYHAVCIVRQLGLGMMNEASGSCMHMNVHNHCSPIRYFYFALAVEELYNRWISVGPEERE